MALDLLNGLAALPDALNLKEGVTAKSVLALLDEGNPG